MPLLAFLVTLGVWAQGHQTLVLWLGTTLVVGLGVAQLAVRAVSRPGKGR